MPPERICPETDQDKQRVDALILRPTKVRKPGGGFEDTTTEVVIYCVQVRENKRFLDETNPTGNSYYTSRLIVIDLPNANVREGDILRITDNAVTKNYESLNVRNYEHTTQVDVRIPE